MPFSQPRDGTYLLCLLHWQASFLPLASPISSVQFCHKSCLTLCDPMDCSTPGFTVHHQLPKLAQIHVHRVGDVIQPSHPLLSPLPPSMFPSFGIFSNESVLLIRWPKYWSFSSSISPSNEYLGLISFRIYYMDLLAVQATLKGLLQHNSSKASILLCSAFFIVQISHPYVTTRKNIALTRWAFVGKVMSPLFNMLSRLIIAFLPNSNFTAAVTICSDFVAQKIFSHCFHYFPNYLPQWFKIGKEVHQGCILLPCLFNFCQHKYQQLQICR